VVSGALALPDSTRLTVAIKLMRMDQVHYAARSFARRRSSSPDCAASRGWDRWSSAASSTWTRARRSVDFCRAAPPAQGDVLRIGPDALPEFLDRLDERIEAEWTPYLAVERQAQEDNLLFLCDAGLTHGNYQPTPTLATMAVQICEVLQTAHEHGIVYRDHKLLHYYWQDASTASP